MDPAQAATRVGKFNDDSLCPTRDTQLVAELKNQKFNIVQIAQILDIIENTCKQCWDAPLPCRCWDDS